MAEKPKTNVDKFFEIYDADPALQARVQQAMDSYPGSLEIRDVMTEHVLLRRSSACRSRSRSCAIMSCSSGDASIRIGS